MEMSDKENVFKRQNETRKKWVVIGILAIAVGFVIGILVGRYALCDEKEEQKTPQPKISEKSIQDGDPNIWEEIMNDINSDNIRTYLQKLTEFPHLAGTEKVHEQANDLKSFWLENGLDEAVLTPYNVLLSYPNTTDPDSMNRLFVYNDTDDIEWQSDLFEPVLHPSENKSNVVPPFNAYSAPADINSTDLVYVNYGRVEDFLWLQNNQSINVTGKIVLARYGKIFRGDKVKQAWLAGAIGMILYSDPADYAIAGASSVYPDSWWLPPSGTQRGSILKVNGDPLTPGYPSTDEAYRLDENDPDANLPKIPTHPIGYGVAKTLLQFMDGDVVPDSWKGALNLTYRLGGKLKDNRILRMRILTKNYRRTTYNAFGIIRGAVEPDRYVLLGAHRDAWVFGSMDNSGGDAVMMEVARVMGNMVKSGKWRPRRTIIFCSWGAEEYGLIGSTEFVEQYVKNLGSRAIAYMNVDIPVQGNFTLASGATPLMYQPFFDATKRIPNPDPNDVAKTLYDRMMMVIPAGDHPMVLPLGSGSDFAPFIKQLGVPSVHFTFSYDIRLQIATYPLYHSKYETFYAVDNFVDRGFKYHRAIGQVWAEMTRNLADSLIIPFNISYYDTVIKIMIRQLDTNFGELLRNNSVSLVPLTNASQQFTNSMNGFKQREQNMDMNDPLAIRSVNDQLMLLDRAFTDPAGLPGRPLDRHLLYADSSVNTYAGSFFPGLVDSLFEIEKSPNKEKRWKIVKQHLSAIVFAIESAASTLRSVSAFMP